MLSASHSIRRYNMTQHIKTHFKERGINSLAANGYKTCSVNDGSSPDGERFNDVEGEGGTGMDEDDEEGFEEEEEEEIEPC